jgi:hypothetical protein
MEKFNRIYSLKVEVDNGVNTSPLRPEFSANKNVEITLPYTVEFQISRRSLTSAQTGTFRVYNLGADVRSAIQKDVFQFTQLRAIQFRAGYDSPNGKFAPIVFNGTVLTAYSWREGENWITEIEAFDGGYQMANANNVSLTLSPGAAASSVITQLAQQLPNLTGTPIVGSFPSTNLRGEVLFGNAWSLIVQKSNGLATIDNGQVKALNYNEVIQGEIPLISSETGLLGSPKRTTSTLEFDMIFEPRLTVGQIVRLESSTNRQFSRNWKVLGFDHQGTISPAVGGDCLTSVRLWFTTQDLQLVPGTPVQ